MPYSSLYYVAQLHSALQVLTVYYRTPDEIVINAVISFSFSFSLVYCDIKWASYFLSRQTLLIYTSYVYYYIYDFFIHIYARLIIQSCSFIHKRNPA